MTHQRRPWIAALLSLLEPGLGQVYVGRPKAALTSAIGVQAAAWLVLSTFVLFRPTLLLLILGLLAILGALAANVLHAGLVAYRRGSDYELRPYNRWYGYVVAFILLAVWHRSAYSFAQRSIAEPFRVASPTMEPTLLVGDYLYSARVPRSVRTPRHGAIVVFLSVDSAPQRLSLVKRVIGTAGDTLQMVRDTVYRNGNRLDEPYASPSATDSLPDQILDRIRAWQLPHYLGLDPANYHPTIDDWGPIVVPADSCFLMGDNRDESYDSRFYGFVPSANIQGQPRFIYFSYDPQSAVIRWGRIAQAIH